MTICKRILAFSIACLLVITLCGQALSESYTVYVRRDGAKVYNIKGKALGKLDMNTRLELTGMKGDICQVERDGKTAYMKKGDLSREEICTENCDQDQAEKAPSCKKVSKTVYVAKDGAKIYNKKGHEVGRAPLNTELKCTDIKGDICRVERDGKTAFMRIKDLSEDRVKVAEKEADADKSNADSGKSAASAAHGAAIVMDWWDSDIQKIFSRGTTATITDVATGLSWKEKRRGGSNHADVQPVSAADTAVLKKVYGGKWSWERRPIFVTINGVSYAASMNGMPHGSGAISDNNFDGHHCIHFVNSRTHGSNSVCPLHQEAIRKAASAKL